MRRHAWVWLAGCIAWTIDFLVNALHRNMPHAELAFILAVLFGIAYAFYITQGR